MRRLGALLLAAVLAVLLWAHVDGAKTDYQRCMDQVPVATKREDAWAARINAVTYAVVHPPSSFVGLIMDLSRLVGKWKTAAEAGFNSTPFVLPAGQLCACVLAESPDMAQTAAVAVTHLPAPPGLHGGEAAAWSAASRYWSGTDLLTAVAIAGAESTWRNITGPTVGSGTMRGMWQINDGAHRDLMARGDWRDPQVDAWMAYQVWKAAGRSWTPWTTYTSGAYRSYLRDASFSTTQPQQRRGPTITPLPLLPRLLPQTPDGSPQTPASPLYPGLPGTQCPGGTGGRAGTDGRAAVPVALTAGGNPRTPAQAIAWDIAHDGARVTPGMCDRYVALAYGWPNSGSDTAALHWAQIPAAMKHPGMSAPPAGALVFWNAAHGAGHVAVSLGDGRVGTTDWSDRTNQYTPEVMGIATLAQIDRWGPRYGWSVPYFPGHHSRRGVTV
jgi:hypothetical protein